MKIIWNFSLYIVIIILYPLATLPVTWSSPITLSAPWQEASLNQIAVSLNNSAITIWQRFDGDYMRIQASHFDPVKNSWNSLANVATISSANLDSKLPQIAMDANGNAFAVWQKPDLIEVSSYNASTNSWIQPLINTNQFIATGPEGPQVAMSDNERAIVIWKLLFESTWYIVATIYSSISLTYQAFFIPASQEPFAPITAMDPDGNAIVTWYEYDGNNWRIKATHYNVVGNNWGSITILSSANYNAYNPQVDMDSQDNGIVTWQITDTLQQTEMISTWTIQAVWYDTTTGWDLVNIKDLAQNVDVGSSARYPDVHIAMSRNGKALFTWFSYIGIDNFVQASLYDGSTWSLWNPPSPTTLSEGIKPVSVIDWPKPKIAIDDTGNGIATWTTYDTIGNKRIQASYYNGTNWFTPANVPIVSIAGQDADESQVAMDTSGNALITWKRPDGTNKSTLPSGITRIQAIEYKTNT